MSKDVVADVSCSNKNKYQICIEAINSAMSLRNMLHSMMALQKHVYVKENIYKSKYVQKEFADCLGTPLRESLSE